MDLVGNAEITCNDEFYEQLGAVFFCDGGEQLFPIELYELYRGKLQGGGQDDCESECQCDSFEDRTYTILRGEHEQIIRILY